MSSTQEMRFHPAANIFPMDEENLQGLADDIRKHGQQVAIELMDGQVLDGRRRWQACILAQVKPKTRTVQVDDPVAYVCSLNLHRRQLTPSQRSIVSARVRDFYDAAAKDRMSKGGSKHKQGVENLPPLESSKARDAAGKAVGISGKYVDFGTKVLKHGTPELVKAVEEGRVAVDTAASFATEPPEVQAEMLNDPKRRRKYKSGLGGGSTPVKSSEPEPEPDEPPPGQSRGVGIERAHEAIACLKRIPKNDGLRKRGFQVVTDWIRHNSK